MDTKQILADPDFQGLPFQEKAKVLSAVDPDFAGLPPGEQTKALYALTSRREPQAATVDKTPEWAGRYPNLYGAYGAGKELLRTGIESGAATGGAALGAMAPIPGSSIFGAGAGYAGGKRLANALFGESVDASGSGIATDVALGGVLQGAGKVVGMIPGVKRILAPSIADIGPAKQTPIAQKVGYTLMEKSMKVPPSVHEPIRNRAINTALREDIPVTKGGLNRVQGIMDDLTARMDDVIAKNPNAPIKIDDVLGPVNQLKDFASKTVGGKVEEAKVQRVIDNFVKPLKDQYGDYITAAQAQEIKQNTNAMLRKHYGELKNLSTEAKKQIVRGLKDKIAAEISEITGVNARYSDLAILRSALERAVNRTGNWDFLNLSAGMAGAIVGGATGNVLKATEAVAAWRILKSPVVSSNLARILYKYGAGSKANAMANTVALTTMNKLTGSNETTQTEQ